MLNLVRRPDLAPAIAAFRRAGASIQDRIRDATRTDLRAGWVQELERPVHVHNRTQVELIANGIATPFDMGITATAGSMTSVSGGASAEEARSFEFGTLDRERVKTYTGRSPKGKRYQVTRRTRRQLPPRSTKGWIAYPAKDRFASRVGKLYGAIVAKVLHEATEGKAS